MVTERSTPFIRHPDRWSSMSGLVLLATYQASDGSGSSTLVYEFASVRPGSSALKFECPLDGLQLTQGAILLARF